MFWTIEEPLPSLEGVSDFTPSNPHEIRPGKTCKRISVSLVRLLAF